MEPKIIFEDDLLVVADKPAGMITNNSKTSGEETVQNWFARKHPISDDKNEDTAEYVQKGGVVHRLDKETSGLLVLAKNSRSYAGLKEQFLHRNVKKSYLALVHGIVEPENGLVSKPIVRHPKLWGKFTIGEDLARMAVTEWKTTGRYERAGGQKEIYSLMSVAPLTGRTHQIRVHMKYLGHPIVSDPLYNGRKVLASDRQWCPRLFLHAGRLELIHPETDKSIVFESGLPRDLKETLKTLAAIT